MFRPWFVYSFVLKFLLNFCDKIGYWSRMFRPWLVYSFVLHFLLNFCDKIRYLSRMFRPWFVYSFVLQFLLNFCDKIGYCLSVIRINELSIRIFWHMALEEILSVLQSIISLYEIDCPLQLLEVNKYRRKKSVTCLNVIFKMPKYAMWRHARPGLCRICCYFSAY